MATTSFVKFWADAFTNFDASKAQSDTLYFITNTGQLYKGNILIADKTPSTLPNTHGLQLYAQNSDGGVTLLHTYDGSSPVKLEAGAFVQFNENPDGTITIDSADSKVTSADNHYTPEEDIDSALSASSSTAATWNTTSLVTGLKRDAKGHVVGVTSIKMPANPNTTGKNVIGAQNATSNSKQSTNGNVYLTHVDGTTAKSTHQIKGSGKVTVTSDANGNITIDGAKTTLADLELDNIMHYLGASSTAITDGGSETPTISNVAVTPKAGDVVLYDNKEFIYNASNKWELFGDEGSYVLKTRSINTGAGLTGGGNLTEDRTIAYEVIGVRGAAKVLLKPAAAGTGVIAGGAVRAVLELAGIRDILSKSLGARTKNNMANATLDALKQIKTPEHIAKLRGKTVEEILG